MTGNGKSVAEMIPGETAIIAGFSDPELSVKLLEMGFLPGTAVIAYNANRATALIPYRWPDVQAEPMVVSMLHRDTGVPPVPTG